MQNIYAEYANILRLIAVTEKALEDSQTQDIFHPGYGVADAFVMLGKLKQDAKIRRVMVDMERRRICSRCAKKTKKKCIFFNDKVPLELTGPFEYTTKCFFPKE